MKSTVLTLIFGFAASTSMGLGATRQMDDLLHPADRYFSRFPRLDLYRRRGPAGRLRPAISNR